MFGTLFALVLAVPGGPPADTVVDMRRGERVVLENLSGAVEIEGWDAEAVDVRGRDGATALGVYRSGSVLRIGVPARAGGRRRVDASIRIPRWADISVEGVDLDVRVVGPVGDVTIRAVTGDVHVEETAGAVRVRTVEGEIVVLATTGALSLSSQADDVRVAGASGALDVRSGSGDVFLERIAAPSVRAETQDGDIRFSGALATGGGYGFFVHAGDVLLELPAETGAQARVSTFDGEFRSEFAIVVPSFRSGRAFEFTLGDGGADLTVEVFDGEIRLVRAGSP